MFWNKKEERKSYPVSENDIFKFSKEDIDKISKSLEDLNIELLEKNNEKLRLAGVRI